ncbi:hypothetical protein [Nocardiopsis sp. NPDC006832]|uniref:hypothetical protein n=1 Tax=Nocardiopsis sp. NPDC006832 TaxID=3157188 RepID=UPI0033E7D3B4
MTMTRTRARLRGAVHVTPVEGGLLFIGWQESMVVKGSPALARLWEALFPHLHEGVALDELVGALPESARGAVTQLLEELLEKGFLLAEPSAQQRRALVPEHPDHDRTFAFLESAAPDPVAAFTRLREHPVVVHGEGPVALAATRCLLNLGAGAVSATDRTVVAELGGLAEATSARLDHSVDLSTDGGPVRLFVDPAVPYAEDAPWTGAASVGVAQMGRYAVIGPVRSAPEAPDLGWALYRLRARTPDAEPAPVPYVAATMAGNVAALQVFYHLTGVVTEYDGMAYVLDTERLQTTSRPVWRANPVRAIAPDEGPSTATDPDRLIDLCDDRTGILPEAVPGELPQMPLALAMARLPDRIDSAAAAFGWAHTGDVARYRAGLEAARNLVGDPPEELWPTGPSESGNIRPSRAVACAGSGIEDMIGDGVQRLLAEWISDPEERGARFVTESTHTFPTRGGGRIVPYGDPSVDERLRSALGQAGVVTDTRLTAEVSRPRSAPGAVALVEVYEDGRVLARIAHADTGFAILSAVQHATAVLQAGGERPLVPVLAVPPGAVRDTRVPDWPAREVLTALCLPGESPVAGRWSAEPALDMVGSFGWVGVAREEDR